MLQQLTTKSQSKTTHESGIGSIPIASTVFTHHKLMLYRIFLYILIWYTYKVLFTLILCKVNVCFLTIDHFYFCHRKVFVEAYVDYVLNQSVEQVFNEFKRGFYKVCDRNTVNFFWPEELRGVMLGSEEYDWDTFKKVNVPKIDPLPQGPKWHFDDFG